MPRTVTQKKLKVSKVMEAALWESANKLRGAVEPAEYKHVDFDAKMKELQIDLRDLLKQEEESTRDMKDLFEKFGYSL